MKSASTLIELNRIQSRERNADLHEFDLSIRPGELHALFGEDLEEETLVCEILTGTVRPDGGRVQMDGRQVAPHVSNHRKYGIEYVSREHDLIGDLTVLENFYVASMCFRRFPLFRTRLSREIGRFEREYGLNLPINQKANRLRKTERYYLLIVIALHFHPKLLILNKVENELSLPQMDSIMTIISRMKAEEDLSVLLITHHLERIFQYADTVTAMRNGQNVFSAATSEIDRMGLLEVAYTQAERSRQRAKDNAEFLRFLKFNLAILVELPVPLVIIDSEELLKVINIAARDFFGSAAEEVSLDHFLGSQNREIAAKIRSRLHVVDKTIIANQKLQLRDRTKSVDIVVNPIFDTTEPIGHILIFNDITEQVEMQEQVLFAEKLASVGILSAGVAHQINQPLGIISNIVEFLKLHLADARFQDDLEGIGQEVSAIGQIINNLVCFADETQVREMFELIDLLQSVASLTRFYAFRKKIRIKIESEERDYQIYFNRNEMQQVLLNILQNAFDELDNVGGTITIRVTAGEDCVFLSIEDSGRGIPEERLDDIFLPFYSSKGARGMGLGLYLSHNIMTRNGGTIAASRGQGGGTVITLGLPIN